LRHNFFFLQNYGFMLGFQPEKLDFFRFDPMQVQRRVGLINSFHFCALKGQYNYVEWNY